MDLSALLHAHLQVTMIGLGHRLGLFEVLADGAPRTADEVAAQSGLAPRYVREWLGAVTAGGVVDLDPDGRFRLPAAHAAQLTGQRAANVGPVAAMLTRLTGRIPAIAERFADGEGIAVADLLGAGGPPDADALGATRRYLYDETFVDGFLGAVPGLHDRLRAGADVLDVGCGWGQTSALLARAFPACRVLGVDVVPDAVARARAEHGDVPGLAFGEGDAATLDEPSAYDVVLAVDVVHDLPHPERALAAWRRTLRDDGLLVVVDVGLTGDLPALLAGGTRRAGADAYAISLLHCLPSGLADGGAGWGAMVGRGRLVEQIGAAGFTDIAVHPTPRPQNAVFVARPGHAVSSPSGPTVAGVRGSSPP